MELNVKTLYLIGGIVTVCSAGAAFLTWYLHREAPALRAWTAALLLTSLGALALRFRTSQADVALSVAADMVIVAGFAAMWLSLRYANRGFNDLIGLSLACILVALVFLALFVVLRALGAGRQAASIPFSLTLGLLGLASAREIWQGRHRDRLQSRLPAALAFVGLGVARVIRAGVLGFEVIHVLPPGAAAATHPYTLYATIVFIVVVTYGLVMMANEQAGRREAMQFGEG
ncbi:hypothetical protein [Reyranella sp.]|jgi:hypothetical protein|uniref:hypothetical protein n=1 Tax=Reyranella sp. TaxID=1929291 RepID=UPI000BDDD788|nr:hypothetical protein [Reyranella sp.]OYY38724.1 MAG: hypothetical protein B7Y57_20645 [Rhodospirillales bacterium 35-66-84]OYZ92248.1 MAG: hypothetical protein B7Y08_22830 [Rhodospirillales bacterium 24-66-33]OZB23652.1 MAG: hypothetical protein B7X63_19090 [Rhodospirillales bacterium 39-66-50]HQS15437.1 hypothetical protein [Reyranella sp.]HQT11963.1 hypothetical protein [Reyranella sp.]